MGYAGSALAVITVFLINILVVRIKKRNLKINDYHFVDAR